MAMQQPTTHRYGAKITTVDPAQGLIEAALKDGTLIQISVYSIPAAFRWPQVGEAWMVQQMNGSWYLEGIFITSNETPVTNYAPGEIFMSGVQARMSNGDFVLDSPVPPPLIVTGSRSDGSAVQSLLTQLAAMGLILNHTTA